MFVGPIQFFRDRDAAYAAVTPVRALVREHTEMRHDLPRQQADDSRLARAAQISLRGIESLDRVLDPVE